MSAEFLAGVVTAYGTVAAAVVLVHLRRGGWIVADGRGRIWF